MAKRAGWLIVAMVSLMTAVASAQYQGFLPAQTGGCEKESVTFSSNRWGQYVIRQRDLDTLLVGYPPYQREVQVVDRTCYAVYLAPESRPHWWIHFHDPELMELTSDGTHRYRVEGLARRVTSRQLFHDRFELRNARSRLDPFLDAPLLITQTVYVEP
jgi:hypothetical protein